MNEQQRIRRERLRWHSRRALLELDLVMRRFWQSQPELLDDLQAEQLECLLAMEDHDLW
jgi:antitoxin CptB